MAVSPIAEVRILRFWRGLRHFGHNWLFPRRV